MGNLGKNIHILKKFIHFYGKSVKFYSLQEQKISI